MQYIDINLSKIYNFANPLAFHSLEKEEGEMVSLRNLEWFLQRSPWVDPEGKIMEAALSRCEPAGTAILSAAAVFELLGEGQANRFFSELLGIWLAPEQVAAGFEDVQTGRPYIPEPRHDPFLMIHRTQGPTS